MKNIAENELIRFISITKKKAGIFVNFKVKGMKGGTEYSSTINVDLSALELSLADPLERIIEDSARLAVKEFRKAEMQFEGV